MSDKFNNFINRVLKHEGGYVNNPKDPGGETHWGITKQTAREYGYKGEMCQLTREQAIGIYKKAFWERYQCENYRSRFRFSFLTRQLTTAMAMLRVCCNVRWVLLMTA